MEQTPNRNKPNMVLYHGDCADGFGSAFIIWYFNKESENPSEIEYIPCKHGVELDTEFMEKITGKNVLMCDFSYKYDQLIAIIDLAKSFKILDHHKTAQADLEKIPDELKIFDMTKSGVGITWEYFFPDTPLPKFLAHIQDRDLWKYEIEGTNAFSTYLSEQKFTFELFDGFMDENNLARAIQTGSAWLEYKQLLVNRSAKYAHQKIHKINGKLMIVLYSNANEFASDVGNKIFTYYPMADFSAIVSHSMRDLNTRFSLRSMDDRQDVSEIAKQFGGGGHRNASGMATNKIVLFLPYEDDYNTDILEMMWKRKLGPKVYLTGDIPIEEVAKSIQLEYHKNAPIDPRIQIEYEYTILEAQKIKDEWLSEDYLKLIKTKLQDSRYIVFQTPSESVNYDAENKRIIPMNDYCMLFNEYNLKNTEDKFKFYVLTKSCPKIVFTTEKSFEEIFKKILERNNFEQVENIIEDESSDSEKSDDEDSY